MVAKKVLILFSLTSLVNLGTYEDFNEENPKKSIVEEDISITENNWNTRKWGSIYFLVKSVPLYVYFKIRHFQNLKFTYSLYQNFIVYILPFFISAGVKYQYFFHKNWGISINLSFTNNIIIREYADSVSFINRYHSIWIFPSIECIYKRKLKHIFSCSFSFISINISKELSNKNKEYSNLRFSLPIYFNFYSFQYEYNRCFLLKYGLLHIPFEVNLLKFSESISDIKKRWEEDKIQIFKNIIIGFLLDLEFELNIIGLNDLRKKKNK